MGLVLSLVDLLEKKEAIHYRFLDWAEKISECWEVSLHRKEVNILNVV